MRQDIRELIRTNRFCVLATVADDVPHCSLMSYATDDDCREIYMATHKKTKKYRNLTLNPAVSVLIDSREEHLADRTKALTISGTLQKDVDENRLAAIRSRLFEKHAELKNIFSSPDTEIIVVKIQTVQLLDGITNLYFEPIS